MVTTEPTLAAAIATRDALRRMPFVHADNVAYWQRKVDTLRGAAAKAARKAAAA